MAILARDGCWTALSSIIPNRFSADLAVFTVRLYQLGGGGNAAGQGFVFWASPGVTRYATARF